MRDKAPGDKGAGGGWLRKAVEVGRREAVDVLRLLGYLARVQGAKGQFSRLPGWARLVVLVFALPGLVLLGLSLLAILVSLFALLLLTVPVYRLLAKITGAQDSPEYEEDDEDYAAEAPDLVEPESVEPSREVEPASDAGDRPRRQIDVKIIES